MSSQPFIRSLTLALAVTLTLALAACCERPQPESSKVAATAAAPVTPPAAPPAADRYPATLAEGIDFRKPGYPTFLAAVSGLFGHEPWGRWSEGETVVFQFAEPLPTRFTLALTARAFGPNIGAPIKVKAGPSEQTLTLTAEAQTHRLNFTLAAPTDRLEFHVPQPISPAELKLSDDPRKLGVGFVTLQLETVEAPASTLSTPPAKPAYAASIETITGQIIIEQGGFATITLTLANRGTLTWASDLPNPVNFSYHLLDGDGQMLAHDNPRTTFPQPVAPGQTATLTLKIGADRFPGPGQYRLGFDLVHEGQTWFANKGSPTLTLPITVTPLKKVVLDEAQLVNPGISALEVADAPEFGQLWRLIQNTLAYTHQEFTIGERRYQGFVAGGGYPQLWARDSATALHGGRWFFPQSALRDWIELLLTHQNPDGNIPDWVNARNQTDKNTVETDQETSLVIGAGHYRQITGDVAWLTTPINGQPLLSRLDRALEYVWRHRRDAASGLLIGAHTIDWGDVELGECTQDAIYAGPGSLWTVDLYDQAMFVLAARWLVDLHQSVGQAQTAQTWRQRADTVTEQTRAQFWQPERGYFRMHRHLSPHDHPLDEDALFPMGGNAVAIQANIATPDMAKRIFATASQRQAEYTISTISGVLLPPYPDGVYCHPAVNKAWRYQNGGQWDWFGARLILAMYEAGHSDAATAALHQVAAKNVTHLGLNEWDDRTGNPKGSPWYSGSAGVLSRTLIEGYFGIDSQHQALALRPRLKGASARIALREPATGRYVAYDYRYDARASRLQLTLRTDHPGTVQFALALPTELSAAKTLIVNGQSQPLRIQPIGEDQQAVFTLTRLVNPTVITIQ